MKRPMNRAFLMIDNVRDVIVRFVNGEACERYRITDRQEFDRDFTQDKAERLRQGVYWLSRATARLQ